MYDRYLSILKDIEYCAKPGANVLVRIDINSPIDVKSKCIIDDYRFKAHAKTIKYLVDNNVRTVIISHQGRPGREDFTSLEIHQKILEKYVGVPVKFIDDVMGPAARKAIKELKPGEVLLLDNVRFVSEEVIERRIEVQAKTYIVKRLAPLFDYFIFDAFATAHRSQPTVVGFPLVLPSCIGLVMKQELESLSKLKERRGEGVVLVVGGAKVPETIRAVEEILGLNMVDKVLVGGFIGAVFIAAKYGYITSALREMLEKYGLISYVDYAKRILSKYDERIKIPIDVAVDINNSRVDVDIYSINSTIMDIGSTTIRVFLEDIKSSASVIVSGPLGYIEDDKFISGTGTILKEALNLNKYTIVSGGHTIAAARKLNLIDKISHISTGGRAFLEALISPNLPALKALEISTKKFWVK